MKRWLIPLLFSGALYGASLDEAIDELKENPYGFALVDVGITEADLACFNSMDIQGEQFYHQFGELDKTRDGIAAFLGALGANEYATSAQAAARLAQIVSEVIEASGKETAWVHLRSSVPTDRYDLPRWHMDGYFYVPEGPDDLLVKFAATLMGPPTLFYRLPPELRGTAAIRVRDRQYMKQFCQESNIVTPNVGEGAVFVGGRRGVGVAALHSEPPIHENRIFFSIVPCKETQLAELKKRVLAVYPKSSAK